jgi:PAS domain S-box-containing protein
MGLIWLLFGAYHAPVPLAMSKPQTTDLTASLGIDDPFGMLVAGVSDYAVFFLDASGRVISWNRGAERIKGYAAEEIIGRHFSTFYPAEAIERGWPEQELELAEAQGRFEDEGWRLRKDGSRFWASVLITAVRDPQGRLRGFSKITRDMTERRRHEESLRQTEERLRLLVESVRDYAIYMLDVEGRVASWNAGAERIKGYTASEIIGRHFSLFYPQEARDKKFPEQELALAKEHGRYEEEGLRVRKNGVTFWASIAITPVYDAHNALRGYAKVTRDLSERKRTEALEESARRMNEFLAMLAHELRNPLAPIASALNLLAKRPTSDATELWVRDVLRRQTAQLSRLVDDLLDVSRITRAAMTLERRALDLRKAVRGALDASMQWIEPRRHVLDVRLPDEPVEMSGDEVRLTQVVQNLLHNAAKYTPDGGRIEVELRREADEALIVVRDNGVGMAAELLSSAFELFTQGSQSLDRAHGGLGVGLTLVQRLVKLHGGTVEARSPGPGKGSEFLVRLPLSPRPEAAQIMSAAAPAPAAPAPRRRVLVVDDNKDAANALALLLEAEGHEVRTAADGVTGLALAREYGPEVVLLDISLPRLDGYEIARRMREDAQLRSATLIAITGYGQSHDRARAAAAGFDYHLTKPVEYTSLQRLFRG